MSNAYKYIVDEVASSFLREAIPGIGFYKPIKDCGFYLVGLRPAKEGDMGEYSFPKTVDAMDRTN